MNAREATSDTLRWRTVTRLDRGWDAAANRAVATGLMIWLTRWGLGGENTCRLTNFDVLDARGRTVGVVKSTWPEEATNDCGFLAVRLNWRTSMVSIVPATGMRVDHEKATVQVAYTEEQIKQAPSYELQPPGQMSA